LSWDAVGFDKFRRPITITHAKDQNTLPFGSQIRWARKRILYSNLNCLYFIHKILHNKFIGLFDI